MAHIHDPAPRTIYAIVDQNRQIFYIGKTYPHRVKKMYSEHIHGRVRKTQEMFANSDTPLPLYILEEAEMSTTVAFRHCVAWTRYFQEHGFAPSFPDALSEYAADMIPETQRIYESIKNRLLDDVVAPDKALPLPRGKSNQDKNFECIQLSVRFTPQEYTKVAAIAAEHNFRSTTAYCKHIAISGRVIKLDLSLLTDLIDYYRDTKTLLRQILLAIYKSGKYYPADMENIQKCIDRMNDMLGQVLDMSINLIHTIRRDGYEDISNV